MNGEAIAALVERIGMSGSAIIIVIFFMMKFFSMMENKMSEERKFIKEERETEAKRTEKREEHYIAVLENYNKALERSTAQAEAFQQMAKNAFDHTREDLKMIYSNLSEQLESMKELKNSFGIMCNKYATLKREHDERHPAP